MDVIRRVGCVVVAFCAAIVVSANAPAGRDSTPAFSAGLSTEWADATHLLERATFGARPSDVAAVLEVGHGAWLDRQLHPERIPDPVVERALARLPNAGLTPAELAERYSLEPADQARLQAADSLEPEERRRVRRELGDRAPGRILGELVMARVVRSAWSERQLEEVMTQFWFDHFNVFWGKGPDRYLVGDYEQSAIRPHVFGTFEDLLIATARHPAMLVYLDAARSVSPQIPERLRRRAEQAGRRVPGLNENYARELLELHTLGVDGGYSQEDVQEVARVFTGWTVVPSENGPAAPGRMGRMAQRGEGEPLSFVFRAELHDPRDKTVLGVGIRGGGVEEGEAVLRLLAAHPSTARHVASRLATAFVADQPPTRLVDDLATTFLETGGDLRAVTRALFTHEVFTSPSVHEARTKSPFRLLVSAIRVTDARVTAPRGLLDAMRRLGHAPYVATAPTGYPEESSGWAGAGALVDRSNLVFELAAGRLAGVQIDAGTLVERAATRDPESGPAAGLARLLVPAADAHLLGQRVLGGLDAMGFSPDTWNGVSRVPEDASQAMVGLVLASPEFQRH